MDAAVSLDERCWPAFAKTAADRYQACRVSLAKASAYGKAVWSWHPDAGAKPARNLVRAAMGARKPSPQGARYKLSNHCAGKAGIVPTIPVVPSLCTGAAGVADTRRSLRPLQSRGRHKQQLGRDFAWRKRKRSCQRLFEILNQRMFWRASRHQAEALPGLRRHGRYQGQATGRAGTSSICAAMRGVRWQGAHHDR
jgi:hypothetical protein